MPLYSPDEAYYKLFITGLHRGSLGSMIIEAFRAGKFSEQDLIAARYFNTIGTIPFNDKVLKLMEDQQKSLVLDYYIKVEKEIARGALNKQRFKHEGKRE